MGSPFWQSAKLLLNYRRQLTLAAIGLIVSTLTFGSGISLILPMLQLILREQKTLPQIIETYVTSPDRAEFIRNLGQHLINVVPADRFTGFVFIMVVILVLNAIGGVARFVHEYLTITVSSRATMVWRDRIYAHLIQVPALLPTQQGYADMINRLVNDTRILADGLQMVMGRALSEICKMLVALVIAWIIDWRIAALATIGGPVMFGLFRKFGRKIQRASRAAMSERGRMTGAVNEVLSGLSVVKVHNAEGYERRRFRRLAKSLFGEEMRMRAVKAYSSPLVEFLTIFGMVALASTAAWMIIHGRVDVERFIAVLAMLGFAASGIKPVSNLNGTIHESAAAAERLAEMLELPAEESDEDRKSRRFTPLPAHSQSIRFENAGFKYQGQDRLAVADANLTVKFGQTIAIVGTNGSGKSTLLNLLPRLTEPTTGRVFIDDIDISEVSLRSLRRQIAVVTQQTILFNSTIADNIAYGRRYESLDKIRAASEAAYAHEFIEALPQGYKTMLGEDGSGLSGGQRQRLCIARAILRDPAILILDEATSQIDAESEAKINRALREFRHGRTTFIIAHRLSTVVDADLIVVMDSGRIIDQGKHGELMGRCAIYQMLTQTQLRSGVA